MPDEERDEGGSREPADDSSCDRKWHPIPGVRHHARLGDAKHKTRGDKRPEENRKGVESCEQAHSKFRVACIRDEDVEESRDTGAAYGQNGQGQRRKPVVLKGLADDIDQASHSASPWTVSSRLGTATMQ